MRKLVGVVVATAAFTGAGAALAGQGATNTKGEFIDLSVKVSPPIAGTPRSPQGVGISFDSFTGNRINGNAPSTNNGIAVRFNRGFKDNALLFPACTINTKALSTCPKSTQIGTGTAEASFAGTNGVPPTFIPAGLIAYNGKPLSGKVPTIIFIAVLNGKPSAELDFTIKQQPTGPYGLAFNEIVLPGPPSGPVFGITKFSLDVPDKTITRRVRGRLVRVHLLEAPTSCSGSWKFAQTNTFTDLPPLTATDSEPCVSR